MSYTSFSLRKSISDGGSALQRTNVLQDSTNPGGSGDGVFDSGLRADGYTSAIPLSSLQSTFSAEVFERGKVFLEWRLETPLVQSPSGVDYEPIQLMIRASGYGEPITPKDGIDVINITAETYVEQYTDISSSARPYIAPGAWAYYSMFVKYANTTGSSFYEQVATVSAQTPYDFGSVQALWSRIPTYYRELDYDYSVNTQDYGYESGPLYRFVELFGWELDKFRTTIFDTMRINDPNVIHSSAIDALAYQVGLNLTKDSLGTGKLRAVLENIGYLRRTKGTVQSIESYISALSGCGVTTTYDVINQKWVFDVHPMRENLITDPFFSNGYTDNDSLLGYNIYRWWTNLQEGSREYGWGLWMEYDLSNPGTPTVSTSDDKLTITLPQATAPDQVAEIIFYSRGQFTHNESIVYFGSAETTHDFNMRFINAPQDGSVGIESPYGAPYSVLFIDSWANGVSSQEYAHPTRKIFASAPNPTPSAPGNPVYPAFQYQVTLSQTEATTLIIKNPMVEYRNSSGDFFTGDNTNGGYIPNALGGTGDGIYDYHWGTLSENSSAGTNFSYYTSDIYRSKKVTEYVVSNYVAPVNQVLGTDYEINWEVLE